MAFAFVQSQADTGTSANPSVSFSGTPVIGNLFVIVFSSTTKSVADITLPAGYTARVAVNDSAGGCLIIADRLASSTGKPQTLTCTSGGNWDMAIFEFSGVAASSYFDKATSTDYGLANNATPGSITPANTTELFITAARHASASTGEAVDSSFTLREASSLSRLVIGTKIKTDATAENPSLSWNTSSNALAGMVAYSATDLAIVTSIIPAGIITPASIIAKTVTKPIGGNVTPASALQRTVIKSDTGTVTPAAAITKTVTKLLTGGVTPTGAATAVRATTVDLVGTDTPSGTILLAGGKADAGLTTPAGDLVLVTTRLLAATVVPIGILARTGDKPAGGAITPTGAVTVAKITANPVNLIGAIAPTAIVAKTGMKQLSGLVAATGTPGVLRPFPRTPTYVSGSDGTTTVEPASSGTLVA